MYQFYFVCDADASVTQIAGSDWTTRGQLFQERGAGHVFTCNLSDHCAVAHQHTIGMPEMSAREALGLVRAVCQSFKPVPLATH